MPTSRLLSALLAAAAVLAAAAAAGATPTGPAPTDPAIASPVDAPVFVVSGGGWGHGVGMSQWGAYGQAKAGRTFERILKTYYPGTELTRTPGRSVRVLIGDGVPTATFTATGDLVVEDAMGRKVRVRDGTVTLPATFVTSLQTSLKPIRSEVTLTPPVRIRPTLGVTIAYGGVARRGDYVVDVSGAGVLVVNDVPLEAYLRGVVPGEVPSSWPLAALKAQAVAARTYAVASIVEDKPFDLYADARSQVYKGVPAESPTTDRAVLETSGRILTYEGVPARTLYFSSSGGRTASSAEIFGVEIPYLRSVGDPWDAASPNHVWPTRVLTARAFGKAFGLRTAADVAAVPGGGSVELAATTPAASLAQLRVTGADGSSVDLRRTDVRARLGLLSTAFRIGMLSLSPVEPPIVAGAAVTIAGIAREVDAPVLERQRPDGSWQVARKIAPDADGSFSVVVRPRATTRFRLSGSASAGPTVSVVVPSA